MRPPNLTEAARVTRRLLDQYGPARLLRVEELAPGFLGDAGRRGPGPGGGSGGRTDRRPGGRAVGVEKSPGPFGSRDGRQEDSSTMRTNVLYHGNVCLTRGILSEMRENLRKGRKAAGMTQQQMADRLRIGLRHYKKIERGETLGSVPLWDELEDIVHVNQRVLREIHPGIKDNP